MMNHVEHLSDRIETLQLDNRKNREHKRQVRIFNDKVRTSGVDRDALDHQVKERKEKEEREALERKAYATDLILDDRSACVLDQRQKKDERLLNEAIVQFRHQFQQASSRREFDLNDPELLKKQEGVKILPGLTGEDLSRKERERRQQEQLRSWCIQQQQEREQTKRRLKDELNQYDQSRISVDQQALELQKMEEQSRRATTAANRDYNLSLAAEIAQRRLQECREEEENNQMDIMNQVNGDLLTENPAQRASVLGPSRLRRDCYKGMSPNELQQYTIGQLQQAEDKRLACIKQKEKEIQEYNLQMATARTALLLERQQGRANKELRRALDNTNAQLAHAHNAQQEHLQKINTNIADERFFSQFNSSNR